MRSCFSILGLMSSVAIGCGGAAGGTGGDAGSGGAGGSDCAFSEVSAGALVEYDQWVATDNDTTFFPDRPAEVDCQTEDDLGYRAEELGGVPVFSVTTTFCDWVTVTQPLRRHVRQGEMIQLRLRVANRTTPIGAMARAGIVIGDELMWSDEFVVPGPPDFVTFDWEATKDFDACTPVYFHVDNHGNNEYSVVNLDKL